MVSSGDFSAESLMTLARMASQGKLRDEKYGDKTIGLMTIDPMVKEAEKNPFLKAFTELGVVALNANTIAAGSPGYLRAAIDAGAGKDRISPASFEFARARSECAGQSCGLALGFVCQEFRHAGHGNQRAGAALRFQNRRPLCGG